jgi:hypothetical protein
MPIQQSNVALFNPRPARPIAWASRFWLMARRFASSSPAAKKSRHKRSDMARLQTYYREKIVPDLTEKFGYKSVMEVPRSPRSP